MHALRDAPRIRIGQPRPKTPRGKRSPF
jgi:hypothetical protein